MTILCVPQCVLRSKIIPVLEHDSAVTCLDYDIVKSKENHEDCKFDIILLLFMMLHVHFQSL